MENPYVRGLFYVAIYRILSIQIYTPIREVWNVKNKHNFRFAKIRSYTDSIRLRSVD